MHQRINFIVIKNNNVFNTVITCPLMSSKHVFNGRINRHPFPTCHLAYQF